MAFSTPRKWIANGIIKEVGEEIGKSLREFEFVTSELVVIAKRIWKPLLKSSMHGFFHLRPMYGGNLAEDR
jgi:hypothetical protein